MEIKLLINNKAKKIIKKNIEEINDNNKQIIKKWLSETNKVKCFILCENEKIKAFALLSHCDYDPLKRHTNPYILDFIYTFIPYRHNNLAYKLLLHIKNRNNVTAFCMNDESVMLFQKAGYVLTKYGDIPITIFRYP